ncbi:hypothetical protein R1A27_16555 [Methylobacterium sp. NMS12]|uniref:hypothetical protein n=1 Tax=Methylobacterium sp. NMS12 TaxID=3079766 RepID=UPI003F8851BC
MSARLEEALQRAIEMAPANEILTVIAELDIAPSPGKELSPHEFGTRAEWREALAAHQENATRGPIEAILERLRSKGVEVAASGPTAIVRGTAEQIRGATEVVGVRRLSLDKTLSLIEPRRSLD